VTRCRVRCSIVDAGGRARCVECHDGDEYANYRREDCTPSVNPIVECGGPHNCSRFGIQMSKHDLTHLLIRLKGT
jgi:hypothetical protein